MSNGPLDTLQVISPMIFYRPDDQINSVKALKEASWPLRQASIPPEPLHRVTIRPQATTCKCDRDQSAGPVSCLEHRATTNVTQIEYYSN